MRHTRAVDFANGFELLRKLWTVWDVALIAMARDAFSESTVPSKEGALRWCEPRGDRWGEVSNDLEQEGPSAAGSHRERESQRRFSALGSQASWRKPRRGKVQGPRSKIQDPRAALAETCTRRADVLRWFYR